MVLAFLAAAASALWLASSIATQHRAGAELESRARRLAGEAALTLTRSRTTALTAAMAGSRDMLEVLAADGTVLHRMNGKMGQDATNCAPRFLCRPSILARALEPVASAPRGRSGGAKAPAGVRVTLAAPPVWPAKLVDFALGFLAASCAFLALLLARPVRAPARRVVSALFPEREKLDVLERVTGKLANEVNNSLCIVSGGMQLLMEKAERIGGIALRDDLRRLQEPLARIERTVKDFCGLAAKHGADCRAVEVNRLVEEALRGEAPLLDSVGVAVTADLEAGLPPAWSDQAALTRGLRALLANARAAIAAKPRIGGRIWVRTRMGKDRKLTIEVEDDGPGIPRHLRGRLFMPFVSSKPPTQGAGLELAVLRMALERAGGSISAQDRPGGGARFVLQLPGARPRSILLVDDDPDFCGAMKGVIAALGHALDLAGGTAEGMEKLRARSYDLVLCDIRMPGQDGIALFDAAARAQPSIAGRWVFISGASDADLLRRVAGTGRRIIHKPLGPAELRDVLR